MQGFEHHTTHYIYIIYIMFSAKGLIVYNAQITHTDNTLNNSINDDDKKH
jgi:hypothetical protein